MPKLSDTWMPLYIGDYLADTGRLTTEGHGAYLLLLMDYWRNGPPPDDDATLAAITRASPAAWRKLRLLLLPFFTISDGHWRQKRADDERDRAAELCERRATAGRVGASARWQPHAKRIANGTADAPPPQWQNDAPSQSQVQSSQERVSPCTTTDHNLIESPVASAREVKKSINSVVSKMTQAAKPRIDFSDPANRNTFADQKVAAALGWEVVMAARDFTSPNHERAAAACQLAARTLAVTWNSSVLHGRHNRATT